MQQISLHTTFRAPHVKVQHVRFRNVLRRSSSSPKTYEPSVPRNTVVPIAEEQRDPNLGESLAQWLKSPFDFAAFGPRLTVGALLSAPERLQNLSVELQSIQEILRSPAPAEDKGKKIGAELERVTTEFLEKGAYVEADVIRQMKQMLPPEIADQLKVPQTPKKEQPAEYERPMGPISTSTTPTVTELPDDIKRKL